MRIAQAAHAALKNDGVIDATEAAAIAKLVKTSADKTELRQVMSLDNFNSAARADLNKLLGNRPAGDPSPFVGTRLGVNKHGEDVGIQREIGSKQGYDEKEQAMAVARMSGAEPAAVVKGRDNKWHAVETNVNFYGGLDAAADNSTVRGVVPMASNATLNELAKEVREMRATMKKTQQVPEGFIAKQQLLAELTFGTNEVQFNASSTGRKAGKINLNADLDNTVNAPRGLHGPEKLSLDRFEPGKKTAIEMRTSEIDNPQGAQGVLFHEMTHKNDYDLADKWAQKYVDSGRIWVSGPEGARAFGEFMTEQVKLKKISPADAELVRDVALNVSSTTEARAFTKAALAAVQAGAPDVAKDQLVTYARAMKGPRPTYAPPTSGSEVQKALTKELQAAYKQMSPDQKDALKAAVAAAKAANADAWVGKLVFD